MNFKNRIKIFIKKPALFIQYGFCGIRSFCYALTRTLLVIIVVVIIIVIAVRLFIFSIKIKKQCVRNTEIYLGCQTENEKMG